MLTSASKQSMNFARWERRDRTQRMRPEASGKFLYKLKESLSLPPWNRWHALLLFEELCNPEEDLD